MTRRLIAACALLPFLVTAATARVCPDHKTFYRLEEAPDVSEVGKWAEACMVKLGYHVSSVVHQAWPPIATTTVDTYGYDLADSPGVLLQKMHGGAQVLPNGSTSGKIAVQIFVKQSDRDQALQQYYARGFTPYELVPMAIAAVSLNTTYYAIGVTNNWVTEHFPLFAANNIIVLSACEGALIAPAFSGASVLSYNYDITGGQASKDNETLFTNLGGYFLDPTGESVARLNIGDARTGTGFTNMDGDTSRVLFPIISSITGLPVGGQMTGDLTVRVTFDVPMDLDFVTPSNVVATGPLNIRNLYILDPQTVQFTLSSWYKGWGQFSLHSDSTSQIGGGFRSYPARIPLFGNQAQDYRWINGHLPASDWLSYGIETLYGNAASTLESSRAVRENGGVRVTWEVSHESGTAGYMLKRAQPSTGAWEQVAYLPATGPNSTYTWFDQQPGEVYQVWEDQAVPPDTLPFPPFGVDDMAPVSPTAEPDINTDSLLMVLQQRYRPPVERNSISQVPEQWDWVSVCPDTLSDIMQPLANYWNTHGHRALVASLEESGGIDAFPAAWQSYLPWVKYGTLVGGTKAFDHWDDPYTWSYKPGYPKPYGYTADPNSNILKMETSGWMSDPYPSQDTGQGFWIPGWINYQHFFDCNGDSLADMRFGIFPADTRAELTLMVAKTLLAIEQQQSGSPVDSALILINAFDNGHNLGSVASNVGWDLCYDHLPARVKWTKLDCQNGDPSVDTYAERETKVLKCLGQRPSLIINLGTNGNRSKNDWWDQTNGFTWNKSRWLTTNFPFYLGDNCGQFDDFRLYDPRYGPGVMKRALSDLHHGPWGGAGFVSGSFIWGNALHAYAFCDRALSTGCTSAGEANYLAIHDVVARTPEWKLLMTANVFWGDPLVPLPNQVVSATVSVSPATLLPRMEVSPNPAPRQARIALAMAQAGRLTISVFDVQGRRVATIVDGQSSAGLHTYTLDSRSLPVGMYLLSVRMGDTTMSQKLLVVR